MRSHLLLPTILLAAFALAACPADDAIDAGAGANFADADSDTDTDADSDSHTDTDTDTDTTPADTDTTPADTDTNPTTPATNPTTPATCAAPSPRGVVYEHWGTPFCPVGSTAIYTGFAVSGSANDSGGIASLHCATDAPIRVEVDVGDQDGARLYGTEYQTDIYGLGSLIAHNDFDGLCAVCLVPDADHQIMIVGTNACPAGWSVQYEGNLMGAHWMEQSTHEAACVDSSAPILGEATGNLGNTWYPTEAECGPLPCAPYIQDTEVACVVCVL